MASAREFCPQCGNARTGSFRFCRSCGFDYDSAPAAAPAATTTTAPVADTSPASGRPGLFTAAGVLWLIVAALNLLSLLLLAAAMAVDGLDLGDAIGIALAALLVFLAFAVGTGLLKAPTRANAYRSVALAVIFVLLTLVAMADPFGAGEVAAMLNLLQGVAVILAGVLPLLALGQVRR